MATIPQVQSTKPIQSVQSEDIPVTIKRVFKSRVPFCKYIFKGGKEAPFIAGRYLTDIKSEIEELEAEVEAKHPTIYIDSAEKEVNTAKLDPIEEIKRRAIAEFIASQAAANNKANDRGNYDAGKLNVTTSATVAEAAAGSDSGTAATASGTPGASAGVETSGARLSALASTLASK